MRNDYKADSRIIEVYDAYLDEDTGELCAYLDCTDGIVYRVKKGNWLVLETANELITLGYDGVNIYPKDDDFFIPCECMETFVDVFGFEEVERYERTLFVGEKFKEVHKENGHYFVMFENFSVEVIPYEENEEIPWIEKKDFLAYKYVYGCERLITKMCECGGTGKLLLKHNYDYVVRCDKCKRATKGMYSAIDSIKAWETGDVPCDLNDIIIE